MKERLNDTTRAIMDERFGCDNVISLVTIDGGQPAVRYVNGYYEDGAFYIVTHASSGKMRQLAENPAAAICGDWFTGRGVGENIGHPRDPKNEDLMDKIRAAFAEWYGNGHTDENDPGTCILRVRLTEGLLASHGTWYDIDFAADWQGEDGAPA